LILGQPDQFFDLLSDVRRGGAGQRGDPVLRVVIGWMLRAVF
jgi:hypothetical protein